MKRGDELKLGDIWRLTHTYHKNFLIDFIVRANPKGGLWFVEKSLGFPKEIENNKVYNIIENNKST